MSLTCTAIQTTPSYVVSLLCLVLACSGRFVSAHVRSHLTPKGGGEGTLGVLGHRMTRSDLLEHPIIQRSGFSLTDGTEIATHDPGKVGKFRDVEPCPMRVQLLQITGMVKNPWNLLALPVLKTQVRL